MGAEFLDEQVLSTFDYCLKWCCDTALCDAAVWDEEVNSLSALPQRTLHLKGGACFLFDCGRPSDFRCAFDASQNYISGALEVSPLPLHFPHDNGTPL